MASIARQFHLGVELHELGLNTISTQLHEHRPDIFETREEIIIEPGTGRKLILYVNLLEPLAFNLFPVSGSEIDRDGLFVVGKLEFTLTDEIPGGGGLGLITRIRATIEADMSLQLDESVTEQRIKVELGDAQIINLTSNHPDKEGEGVTIGRLNVGPALESRSGEATPLPSDPAFVAILNYLIEVFLKDGLKKPLTKFPVPPLNILVDAGIPMFMRGLMINGNTLGAYLHRYSGGPLIPSGPPPTESAHLSIGIVEETISQILKATFPLDVPIDPTPDNRTFNIRNGSWVRVTRRSWVNLKAPNRIEAALYFESLIKAQINVKLGRYWVRTPIDFPIGRPSRIHGVFNPVVSEEEDEFQIKLRPSADFFDVGSIIVATNYRNHFRNSVRRWLQNKVSPVLKKIPIIGWIVAKSVEFVVGELLAFFVGAFLDLIVSTFLTILLTILFNILRLGWNELLEFKVYSLKKTLPVSEVDLNLEDIGTPRIDRNQGGELILDTWFTDQGYDVPDPPVPTPPQLPAEPPTGDRPRLPDYPDTSFQPLFALSVPSWSEGLSLRYAIVVHVGGTKSSLEQEISFKELGGPDRLQLYATSNPPSGPHLATRVAVIDTDSGALVFEEEDETSESLDEEYEVRTQITYDNVGGTAAITGVIGEFEPIEGTFSLPDGAAIVPSTLWPFWLMSPLEVGAEGKLGRLDVNLGTDYENWSRALPMTLKVERRTTLEIGSGKIDVFQISVRDEEMAATVWIEEIAPHRVIRCDQQQEHIRLSMVIEP